MQLFPHQQKALQETEKFNRVAYYLDMGLGKTFVGSEKANSFPENIILICQKSKIQDWVEHFRQYYPMGVFDLTNKKQFEEFQGTVGRFVSVINYDLVFRRSYFAHISGFTLVIDESSIIQNESAKRSKFILKMKPKNVILLSGTPTAGKYEKLWSQLNRAKRTEVLAYLEILIRENTRAEDANLIAFENGLYNIVDDSFIEFTPEHIITNKIRWKYNPDTYSKLADDVPDRIEYRYEQLYKTLKHEVLNHCNELIDKDFIDNIENRYSTNYGKDPNLLYNCPECGASGSLYIGDYGYFNKDRFSVTCSQCGFRVPHYISDYGEAWCEFKEWLVKNKYL